MLHIARRIRMERNIIGVVLRRLLPRDKGRWIVLDDFRGKFCYLKKMQNAVTHRLSINGRVYASPDMIESLVSWHGQGCCWWTGICAGRKGEMTFCTWEETGTFNG